MHHQYNVHGSTIELYNATEVVARHAPVERHHAGLVDDEAAEGLRQDGADLVLALEAGGEEDEVGLHLGAVLEEDAVRGEAPAGGPPEADHVPVGHVEEAVGEDGHLAAGVVLHEGVVRPEPVLVQRELPRQVGLDELGHASPLHTPSQPGNKRRTN
jgi:hypothetical protein